MLQLERKQQVSEIAWNWVIIYSILVQWQLSAISLCARHGLKIPVGKLYADSRPE